MRRVVLIAIATLALTRIAHAQYGPKEPAARLQLDGQAYAGMPIGVLVVAEGFDEEPTPAQPTLAIAGATVTPIGVEPQVQRISINGQRHDSVTWVFRYRVTVPKAGDYPVPAVTITQGAKTATARGGSFTATEIAATDDMKIQAHLPERPLWLGEVAEVSIDWLLRRDVGDQTLSVPLLSMPKELGVTAAPATDPRQVLAFPAGATDMQLPFVRDQVTVAGIDYTRFRFTVLVTPLRAGMIEVPPAQVVASLEVGQTRDQFGFPTARTQLFRASDVSHTLEVKPLPQSGRPASFAGAVGASFSIATRSSRSVVQLGEPVDLEITVKGDTRLDGLTLGSLSGPGRLPADHFQMPDTVPPGELAEDGKTKTFKVAVQVTDPSTHEIPPIELAWFDPTSGQYRTTKSEPIALSVKGGSVVGAGDVVGGRKPGSAASQPTTEDVSLVGADLALSAPGAAMDRPFGGALLWALIALLYLVPLGVLGLRVWQRRTVGRREEKGEVAAARRRVDDELARARTAPAREVASKLVEAMRALERLAGATTDPVLARIETEGYAPGASERPLPDDLRREAEALAKRLATSARPRGRNAAAAVLLLISLGGPRLAHADAAASIEEARTAYQQGMAESDPTARQVAFARAQAAFADAAASHPDSAELLADWGNAALEAGDFGTATLAFRRALLVDADHPRARRNLAWLRTRLADNLRPASSGGATATLFFFQSWSRATRLLLGAFAFALAALLLVPWRRRPGGARIGLAVVASLVWLNLTTSLLFDRSAHSDGVVVDSQLLRSADAPGAPVALTTPLPPGAEVTVLERRPGWTRIRTAGGATGWLPETAVASVLP